MKAEIVSSVDTGRDRLREAMGGKEGSRHMLFTVNIQYADGWTLSTAVQKSHKAHNSKGSNNHK